MMKRLMRAILFFNVAILVGLVIYFNPVTMYRCGHLWEKPELALGIYPYWHHNQFHLERNNKPVVGNSLSEIPVKNRFVKGHEQFRTITAYGITDFQDGVFFKALDWKGQETTFLVQTYSHQDATDYVYEVAEQTSPVPVDEWAKVDKRTCMIGIFPAVPVLVGLLTVMLLGILSLWFVGTLPQRYREWREGRAKNSV